MLAEATELLERHAPGRELSLAYRRRAGQAMIRGRAAAALVASQKSLELAEELGIREDFSSVLQFRGVARCELGDVENGLADLREGSTALPGGRFCQGRRNWLQQSWLLSLVHRGSGSGARDS